MLKRLLLLILLMLSVTIASEKVFVRNMKSNVLDSAEAATLTDLFASELKSYANDWQIITYEDVASMIDQEMDKDMLDCDDESCMQQIAGALGAPLLISGNVNKLGSFMVLNISLINTMESKTVRKVSEKAKNLDGLIELLSPMALKVAGKKSSGATVVKEGFTSEQSDYDFKGVKKYIVKFESNPSGAVVFVDGDLVCQSSPGQKALTAGSHKVRMVKDMYKEYNGTVTVNANGQVVTGTLTPNFGYLTLTTTPSNIPVEIDGKAAGSTPITKKLLGVGAHQIKLGDDCWLETKGTVVIKAGETKTQHLTVKPRMAGVTIEAVDSATGQDLIAEVWRGGKKLGTTPYSGGVSTCGGSFEVKHKSYGTKSFSLSLVEGKNSAKKLRMAKKTGPKKVTGALYGMKKIPGGTFQMGSNNGDADEKPVHSVTVSGFWMDSTEVTQAEYQRLMRVNPSKFKGSNRPVEQCNWYDAVLYCNARSKEAGLDTVYSYSIVKGTRGNDCELTNVRINYSAKGYRLPTEAEFEYANKAGTKTKFVWGNNDDGGCSYANGADQSAKGKWSSWTTSNCDDGYAMIAPVATYKKNNFGLYDMTGNVWEWCNDWYDKNYYGSSPSRNPQGASSGTARVLRGGGWIGRPAYLRSANRYRYIPDHQLNDLGFRCLLPL